MGFLQSIFLFACITVMNVCGVFLLTGLTGLFSFGQAAFMAVGAYASGLSIIRFGLPFPLAVIIGVATGVITALIVGFPTLKLRRDYFSLITFGFGEAVAALLNYMVKLTGGSTGLSGIPRQTTTAMVVISTVVIVFMARSIKYSRFGRTGIAIKNDELTARSFGINVFSYKMRIFLVSAAISAYAGTLYASLVTYVEPAMFRWAKSAEWVIFVFFGGVNSLTGSITSGAVLSTLPEALKSASEYRILIYCVLVLIILNFRPKGLFGSWELSPKNIAKLFSRPSKLAGSSEPPEEGSV